MDEWIKQVVSKTGPDSIKAMPQPVHDALQTGQECKTVQCGLRYAALSKTKKAEKKKRKK